MRPLYLLLGTLSLLAALDVYLVNSLNGPYRVGKQHWVCGHLLTAALLMFAVLMLSLGI